MALASHITNILISTLKHTYLYLYFTNAALDQLVSRHVFQNAVCVLLKNKTCVIVTHNDDVLGSDRVDVMASVAGGVLTMQKQRTFVIGDDRSTETDDAETEEVGGGHLKGDKDKDKANTSNGTCSIMDVQYTLKNPRLLLQPHAPSDAPSDSASAEVGTEAKYKDAHAEIEAKSLSSSLSSSASSASASASASANRSVSVAFSRNHSFAGREAVRDAMSALGDVDSDDGDNNGNNGNIGNNGDNDDSGDSGDEVGVDVIIEGVGGKGTSTLPLGIVKKKIKLKGMKRAGDEEERAEGGVDSSVYMEYVNSMGGVYVLLFLCCVQVGGAC